MTRGGTNSPGRVCRLSEPLRAKASKSATLRMARRVQTLLA
jgi:hypothetical protein